MNVFKETICEEEVKHDKEDKNNVNSAYGTNVDIANSCDICGRYNSG